MLPEILALLAGLLIGWLLASARKGGETHRALAERDLARQEREKSEALRAEMQRRLEEAQQARAVAESRSADAQRLLDNHQLLQKQLEDSFANLAQKAFRDVGEALVQKNEGALGTKKAEIEALLTPVREMLDAYRGEVMKSEAARVEGWGGLQEQLRNLLSAQEASLRESSRLANALQSPTVQGSWGEMSLKRCIELAGMSEYCRDFETQQTFVTDDGKRLRPDVIVNLPNERVIAVDAKAPLAEYIAACSESDESKKRSLLEQHAKNLRRHIDALSRREYQASIGDTLDFTVMFIPGEHFLSAALITDTALLEYAAEKKVFLASPTVLLPLLRAVATGWKAEKTEENAKRMHDAAVELFNRFVKVMEHLAGVGKALQSTVEKYNAAIGSIDRMLWPKGEELQRMAGSGRSLGELSQIETVPLESSKLRRSIHPDADSEQSEEEAEGSLVEQLSL